VQSALSSCISHLENLIDLRQPDDEQMEYLVTKFEEMAQFLSAPEAQSRQSDDHLFSEGDAPEDLGIGHPTSEDKADELHFGVEYILQVQRYIEAVGKHAQDLKMRMDEVKQLNSIQLDIIDDLRRQLKITQSGEEHRESEEPVAAPSEREPQASQRDIRGKELRISRACPQHGIGFWAALGHALDSVGDMLLEL
jgi:hypothetical protein